MKKLIFLILNIVSANLYAQTTGYIRNDTVKITNATKTATLVLETASKGHGWYLKDIGNGRTQFVQETIADINHLQDSLTNKANDANVIHKTGDESKTNGSLTITNTSNNQGIKLWDGIGSYTYLDFLQGSGSGNGALRWFSGSKQVVGTATDFIIQTGNSSVFHFDSNNIQDNSGNYFLKGATNYTPANDVNVVHIIGDNSTGTQNMVGQKYNLTYTSPALHVHQGITFGGGYIWLITSAWIYKCDANYNRLDSMAYTTGGNHLGGGKYDNGKLYVAFEQLSGGTFSGQKILVFDTSTAGIPLLTSYDVSAQNAEVSGLTINADTITTISFLDGSKVWKYNKNTGTYISSITLAKYMYDLNGIANYNNRYYYFADNGVWTSNLSGGNFSLEHIGTTSFLPANPLGVFESGDVVGGEIRLLIDPSNGGTNPGYSGVVTSYVKYFTPSGTTPAAWISPSGDVTAYGDVAIGEPSDYPYIYSPFKLSTRNYLKRWEEDKNGAPPLATYHNDNVTAFTRNAYWDGPNNTWRYADSSKYAFRMGYNGAGNYEFKIASPGVSSTLTWTTVMQMVKTAIYPGTDGTVSLGFSGTRFLDLQLSGTGYAGNFVSPLSTVRNQLVSGVYLSGITQGIGTGDYNSFQSQIYFKTRNDATTWLAAKFVRSSTGMALDISTSTGLTSDVSLPHSMFWANDGRIGEGSQSPTTYHSFRPSDASYASFNIPVQSATPPLINGSVSRPTTDQLNFKGTALMNFMFNDVSSSVALGSVPYGSGTASHAELAPNTVAAMKFYTETGTGSAGQAPTWFNLFDTSNSFTQGQTISRSNGINAIDGWVLQNPNTATSGGVQVSPDIHYIGAGWNTGSFASYAVDFLTYLTPNSGSTEGGKLTYRARVDGGSYSTIATLDDGGNLVTVGNVNGATPAEIARLSGVTSAIQTQLNAKQATLVSGSNIKTINSTSLLGSGDISLLTNPMTTTGDIIIGGTSGTPARLAKGTDGKVLTMVGGSVAWADPMVLTNLYTNHIVGSSATPTITAGPAAGTGAVVSITGNDIVQTCQVTIGTSPVAGDDLFRVTFANAYPGSDPVKVVFSSLDNNAAQAALNVYISGTDPTYYHLHNNLTTLAPGQTYTWTMIVTQ